MTTPDFRAELERLLDLYDALGGNWTPHNYTDTWNDALASTRAALATPAPEPVAYIHRQGNHWEVSERVLLDDEKKRGWTEEPLYSDTPPPEPPHR